MLPRRHRLRLNRDFHRIYARGRRAFSSTLTLIAMRTGRPGELLVGFSVSKKVGNAVIRNRTKRVLREAFRSLQPRLKTGYRLIFVVRPAIVRDGKVDYHAVCRTMEQLFSRSDMLDRRS